MKKPLAVALVFAAAAFAADACAQTLYKLVDKNGKVTYSEKPPKDFDGKVIRLDIDPNANTATLPKAPPAAERGGRNSDARREGKTQSKEDRVQLARDKLDAARRAYEQARDNPGEEDIARMGKKGGGTRPVMSEAYTAKLGALEAAVKQAEEELRRAEGG
jgi:hypothetical protein